MPELFDILDLAVMRQIPTPVERTYTNGTYTVVDVWNEVVRQGVNTTASTVTNSITIGKAGLYEFTISLNASFAAQEELAIYAYVNGVQDPSGFVAMQGQGDGKPVDMFWSPIVPLTEGLVVDIRGTNHDPGSVVVTHLNGQFRTRYVGDTA